MYKKIWQGVIFPVFVYIIGSVVGATLKELAPMYIDVTLALGIGSIITTIVLYVYARYNKRLEVSLCFNDEKKIDIRRWIYIIPIAFSFSILCNTILNMTKLTEMFPAGSEVSEKLLETNYIYAIFIVAIIVPVTEEILFRGYIYKSIKGHGGKIIASIVSAVLFSIAHGNITQGIYAFVCTFLFIYIYDECDNICAPVFAHIIANGSVLFLGMSGLYYDIMIFMHKVLLLIVCVALFIMSMYRFITYKMTKV